MSIKHRSFGLFVTKYNSSRIDRFQNRVLLVTRDRRIESNLIKPQVPVYRLQSPQQLIHVPGVVLIIDYLFTDNDAPPAELLVPQTISSLNGELL